MTVEAPEQSLKDGRETTSQGNSYTAAASPGKVRSARIEPDLDFIQDLTRQGGDTLKKCFQCGTCSGVCDVSPDDHPFPRKEMMWANWGLKDRLLADPDIWLCYQCNDCSLRCPRGAKPGEMLGSIRQMSIRQHAFPQVLGRWVNQPHCIPLLLGIPAALLTAALLMRDPVSNALGLARVDSETIVFAFSSHFPHWMLNSFFGLFTLLMVLAVVIGVRRFWNHLKAGAAPERIAAPRNDLLPSLWKVTKNVITHEKFDQCSRASSRFFTHSLVFFGFIALTLVAIWVLTARYNPLIRSDFVYPFAFFDPWKMIANAGGLAVIAGCLLMIRDRLRDRERFGGGKYFDYGLILQILITVLTGFGTELLHYLRLEPHRHVMYFVHLVFVFALLMYLPYSKFAHMIYRTAALVFVERYGRSDAREGQDDVRHTATG